MFAKLLGDKSPGWVELEPALADLEPEQIERDQRWQVVVRRALEIDE